MRGTDPTCGRVYWKHPVFQTAVYARRLPGDGNQSDEVQGNQRIGKKDGPT